MSEILISKKYLAEQKRLHADPRRYGTRGSKWAETVRKILTKLPPVDDVLDYGCGQNTLCLALEKFGIKTRSYDPAVSQFAELPIAADFVCCTDVLEHIEPEKIADVLDHICALTIGHIFAVISTVETAKKLSDGRQAHILLRPREWWVSEFSERNFVVDREFKKPQFKPEKQLVFLFRRKDDGPAADNAHSAIL